MKHESLRHADRRSGRIVTYLLVLLFACMGVPVYLWGQRPESPSTEEACTARVLIPLSVADKATAEREILKPENLQRAIQKLGGMPGEEVPDPGEAVQRVRRRLDVSVTTVKKPDRLQVAITYSGPEDARRSTRLVNELARQYAQEQRARLEAAARKSHDEARRAADSAQEKLFQAQAQFDAFLNNHFHGSGEKRQTPPGRNAAQAKSAPKCTETVKAAPAKHPEWIKTKRQLDDLRRRREQLLVDRTPMHPQVRSSDVEILDLEKRLAAIPHEMVPAPSDLSQELKSMLDLPPVPPGPVDPLPAPEPTEVAQPPVLEPELVKTYTQNRDKLATARAECEQRAVVERETWEARYRLPQIEVELARPPRPDEVRKARPSLLVVSLAVGLAGAMGIGMFSIGMAREPILVTEAQARSALSVLVVAAVPPADRPTGRPAARRRRLDGWILAACGVLLILLCLGKVLSALWGVQLG